MADKPNKDDKAAGSQLPRTGWLKIVSAQIANAEKAADFQQHAALSALYTHLVELNTKLQHIEAKIDGDAAEIVAVFKKAL
jgi:hypothetical protein